jgi:uncharacterized protein
MKKRIIGFDLARAYAIFGMFIVNFNFCFGSFQNKTALGRFLNLFIGNSSAIFVILAGMGVSLMTNRTGYDNKQKSSFKKIILKRSWFLFALGLLLYNWWPGDILHFYGGYMHIAAFLLFVPKKYYLWTAFAVLLIFHLLLLVIPIETGWDFNTFKYADFWTPVGFLRNTIYNGWNSIFPWLAYFMLGMWLGRLDWQRPHTRKYLFLSGIVLFVLFQALRIVARYGYFNEYWSSYIMSDYFPAYLPFMLITTGFALIAISICMWIGEKIPSHPIISSLAKTGKMTLSHYVFHLTLGVLILAQLTNKRYSHYLEDEIPTAPEYILLYAIVFFALSVLFSVVWCKRFKNGPLETLMRKISG